VEDPVVVMGAVAWILERLGIPYVVGGAMASTLHGEPRTTLDVDFALQLDPEAVPALVRGLQEEFFVEPNAVADAARTRSHFNVVHRKLFVKADLYVRPPTGLYASEIERAVEADLGLGRPVRVASAEDTVLQKLVWFRAGDEVSDRQWRDVLGILRQWGSRLDRAYLARWAAELSISDLLARAESEARGAV
jgi:hypothetical protein